jgi:hypothetical protein
MCHLCCAFVQLDAALVGAMGLEEGTYVASRQDAWNVVSQDVMDRLAAAEAGGEEGSGGAGRHSGYNYQLRKRLWDRHTPVSGVSSDYFRACQRRVVNGVGIYRVPGGARGAPPPSPLPPCCGSTRRAVRESPARAPRQCT